MTEPLFFDTDCISAFLWVDNESILSKLFPGRIIIPKEVYSELSHPGVNHVKGLKAQIDIMIENREAIVETIMTGTDTYELYRQLTNNPEPGHKIIGRGEAASIALAKEKQGMAFDAGYINEEQGNTIWKNMIARRRKLGYATFSEYLAEH